MSHNNEVISNIEDIVMDFLIYRKSKQSPLRIQSQYEIGKGWPYYKGGKIEESTYDIYHMDTTKMLPMHTEKEYFHEHIEHKKYFSEELYCEINRMLDPYIESVLDEYEYVGSPIHEHKVCKETMTHIIDKVMKNSSVDILEIKEIHAEAMRNVWGRYKLLRALVEANVLHDIYYIRRPRHHHKHHPHHPYHPHHPHHGGGKY